ncbi:MAG: hypothetical protein AB7I30_03980, partial [Isosphaeraceae bacterium]
ASMILNGRSNAVAESGVDLYSLREKAVWSRRLGLAHGAWDSSIDRQVMRSVTTSVRELEPAAIRRAPSCEELS